jgi:glycine/D-amino acid oxidase-like deaminating enzyme
MLGLTLAPVSAAIVADLLDGRARPGLEALDPGRFGSR